MNKTKRNAWHKHLKAARKRHEKAVLARTGRPTVAQAPAAPRPSGRSASSSSRPAASRP